MNNWNQFLADVLQKLLSLGTKKLAALSVAIALCVATVVVAGIYLARPANEVLYSGLGRQEAGRVTAALKDEGVEFDLSSDSSTVYVRNGQAPKVRMRLAQKGLPNPTTSGYELFDKIGSFGLTTFMQDVTRLRAIEGELARTIQMLDGVRGARVHIVMSERASFRSSQQEPSASVVLQLDGAREVLPISAIRHMVASAVPRLLAKNVSIINSNGVLLASPDDSDEPGSVAARRLEVEIARAIKKNISDAMIPYLTADGIRISVAPRINTDRQEVAEKIFIPNSRVERSVRVTRETSDSQDTPREAATTVQQNLPNQEPQPATGQKKSEATQKREELTSYEISQRTTSTVTAGYRLERLSIGVAVNRASLPEALRNPDKAEELKRHLEELEQLIKSAAGFDEKRGDKLKLAVLDMPKPIAVSLLGNSGFVIPWPTIISGVMLLMFSAIVLLLGVRPIVRAVNAQPIALVSANQSVQGSLQHADEGIIQLAAPAPAQNAEEMLQREHHSPLLEMRERLKRVLENDEDTAVSIMKEWLAKERAA